MRANVLNTQGEVVNTIIISAQDEANPRPEWFAAVYPEGYTLAAIPETPPEE